MKKVLEYFKQLPASEQEQFNKAMELYRENNGNANTQRFYNRAGFSAKNLASLHYELKKLVGITEVDIINYQSAPVIEPTYEGDLQELITEKKDIFLEILQDVNAEAKQGFKLEFQFPFLREKDCPNELKILVNDAITAFHDYKNAHEELFAKLSAVTEPQLSNEQVYVIASQLLEDFELNQEIYAELDHYQKNKEILGEHSIFATLKLEREVAKMAPAKLASFVSGFNSAKSKAKKKVDEAKSDEEKAEAQSKLDLLEQKKALVDKKLNEQ